MRKFIAEILKKQAIRRLSKSDAKIVVVVGSVGKTSTTQAIATVLDSKYKIRKTIGNYNTDIGVPCSIFGQKIPDKLYNPFAWLVIFIKNEMKLRKDPKTDVYVLELGTDKPGEISWFEWLNPDIAVVTAVAPEHMEFFKTIDAVAEEELSVSRYSKKLLINESLVESKYVDDKNALWFSRKDLKKFKVKKKNLNVVGDHSLDTVVAALSVGKLLDMDEGSLIKASELITSQPGRMSELKGIKDSRLIDDTYNSSPEATIAALDYIYSEKAPQRIVLLGNMNELGDESKKEHIKIGEYCDPDKLDLVITLGQDANKYTARAATANGCNVVEAKHPHEAADLIEEKLKKDSLVLLKGSQNGVYAEEATKRLLANQADEVYLVRQSLKWKQTKLKSLGKV